MRIAHFFKTMALCCLSFYVSLTHADTSWVVIANPSVELKANRLTLIQIFMMQRLLDDHDHPLKPYSFNTEDERFERFVSQCLHWPPQVMARRWHRSLTTGEGDAPTFVHSESDMENKVSLSEGGLGYLPAYRIRTSSSQQHYKVVYQCGNNSSD